jgi:hypothetical protein
VKEDEPAHERQEVGCKVHGDNEADLRNMVQVQPARRVAAELGRQRQYHEHHRGDHPERERLLQQVRSRLAAERPTAEYVAHNDAAKPARYGCPAGAYPGRQAGSQHDFVGCEGSGRGYRKPAKPLAGLGADTPGDSL